MEENEQNVKGRIEKFEEKPTKDGSRTYRIIKIGNVSGLAFGGVGKGLAQGNFVNASYIDDGKGIRFTKIWKMPDDQATQFKADNQATLKEALEEKIAAEDFKQEAMLRMNAVKTAAALVDGIEDIERRIDIFKSMRVDIYNWLKEVE